MVEEIETKKVDGTILAVPKDFKAFLITDGKVVEVSGYPTVKEESYEPEYPTIKEEKHEPEYPTISKELPSLHLAPTPEEIEKALKEVEEFTKKLELTPKQKEELKHASETAKELIKKFGSFSKKELKAAGEKAKNFLEFLSHHIKKKDEKLKEVI